MNYFAALPTLELQSELKKKISKYYKYKEGTGAVKKWRKAYDLYYGKHVDAGDGSDVSFVGEDGELSAYGINHYRNLIKHVLALTCSQKPSFDYRAKNTDLTSQQQAKLANSIIESYFVEKRLGRHMKQAAERCLVFREGFVYQQWDTTQGRELMAEPVLNDDGTPKLDEDGEPIKKIRYEGDPSMISKSPWDVIRDVAIRDWSKCKWVIIREYENRYDLAAQYPDKTDEIIGLAKNFDENEFKVSKIINTFFQDDESDIIPVYHFYHLPTAAVPSGRFTKFLSSSLNLYDGPYQYANKAGNHKLPVQRITPGEMFDTTDGYTEFDDVMVLQQVLNILMSTAFTNEQAFGVQAVWMPDTGGNLSVEQIGKGLSVLRGGPPGSQPIPLQLTATPAEIFKNAQSVENAMEKLSGINSVVRGDPEHSLKSGAALGRMQAMAIQYSSNFQQAWAELQEDGGTFLLHMLQNFANTKRITALAGKSNKGSMKAWTGKDIEMIDRLICDLGNPMARTLAGRLDMADKWLEKGLIKDPAQYIQAVETGNIEPMTQSPLSKLELIRKENEMLIEGNKPTAMVGDSHIQHCQEHRVILDDPDIREAANAGDQLAMQIVQQTLAHISEHQQYQNTQDPFWFVISGEQPPPPQTVPNGGQPPPEAGDGSQSPMPPPPAPVGPPQQPPSAPPIPKLPPGV